MAKNSELRIQLGLAMAQQKLHDKASREIFLWLDCYEYRTEKDMLPALADTLVHYHRKKHEAKMLAFCPFISGRDEFPANYLQTAYQIAASMVCYFDLHEQREITRRLAEKI